MFSQELENLIQATLEDGVLEPYELDALQKRATAEGVDLTELEIYIKSLLQKRNRELKEKEAAAQQHADEKRKAEMQAQVKEAKEREAANLKALGYKECPKCHEQVSPLTLVCKCGFEFTAQNEVSTVQKILGMFNTIELTPTEEQDLAPIEREKLLLTKKIEIISTYPVPNTKADIVEFLSTSVSLANKKLGILETRKHVLKIIAISIVLGIITIPLLIPPFLFLVGGGYFVLFCYAGKTFEEEKLRDAWHAKSKQVLMKGRSLRVDTEFQQQLNYYENLLNNNK